MTQDFRSLSARQVLSLAVHVERANAQRFRSFAEVFRGYDEEVAERFEELAREEEVHERMLWREFQDRFGTELEPLDEWQVEGVIESVDLEEAEHLIFDDLKPEQVYRLALKAELGAQQFYRSALESTQDAELLSLYAQLAEMEDDHAGWLRRKLQGGGGG